MKRISAIYCIEVIKGNPKKIGFKYIGLSTHCLDRFSDHLKELKGNYHSNPKLQNYFNKYGQDSLRFYILQQCPEEQLHFWEKWWIKCFNSLGRGGFNLTQGGDTSSDVLKKPCIMFNFLTKETVSFSSRASFSRRYNLNNRQTCDIINGKVNFVQNWLCPQHSWRPQEYRVTSPDNKEYTLFNVNISKFCRQHNIKNRPNFATMIVGKRPTCLGWRLANV
jgi:hypothetical protein